MLIVQKVLENATKYVQNAKDKKMSKKRLKFLFMAGALFLSVFFRHIVIKYHRDFIPQN